MDLSIRGESMIHISRFQEPRLLPFGRFGEMIGACAGVRGDTGLRFSRLPMSRAQPGHFVDEPSPVGRHFRIKFVNRSCYKG